MRKVHLLSIDPQNDFCIKDGPNGLKGQLVVPGAEQDMVRLAAFIKRNKKRISEWNCTLDCHQWVHIAHPSFWVNSKFEQPPFFSVITEDDVRNGVWRAYNPKWQDIALNYVTKLRENGRYKLMIWPPHCLIGTWGQSIVQSVAEALYEWEKDTFSHVNFVAKGSNIFTEHYSGVKADVPDDGDESTQLNTKLIKTLKDADEILITGEALSHCVANTVEDIATEFGDDWVKKFTLLGDTTSNVFQCENLGKDFIRKMVAKGMRVTTTQDW